MALPPDRQQVPFYGLWIDGHWRNGEQQLEVRHKYTQETIAVVAEASQTDVNDAVLSAKRSFVETPLSPYERYKILHRVAQLIADRKDHFARTIAREAGKPLTDARAEVDRAVQTFELSGEEAKRIAGHEIPVAAAPGAEGRLAFTRREPVGVVCAITPFNFPLNLVAHKVAPALAAGNTVVLKPSPLTPVSAVHLCHVLLEAGLPPCHVQLVMGSGAAAGRWLAAHPVIDLYSFTGSATVGEELKKTTGLRKVCLELGNNGPNIVHSDAALDEVAALLALRGFGFAGQVCIAVQNVYVQKSVLDSFVERFNAAAQQLVVGDPEQPETQVGPMISVAAAERADQWVHEALAGATAILAGERRDALFAPTILTNVTPAMKVVCEEVFAPIVNVIPYRTLDDVLNDVNDSRYGLQVGVFTADVHVGLYLASRLQAGGVIINDTSSFRVDLMPYGGTKGSGLGREGPRYAIEAMTELKTIVFNPMAPKEEGIGS